MRLSGVKPAGMETSVMDGLIVFECESEPLRLSSARSRDSNKPNGARKHFPSRAPWAIAPTRRALRLSYFHRLRRYAASGRLRLRLGFEQRVAEPAEMIIDVAKGQVDHREPLEPMAHDQLIGHAHAAVQL